MFRATNHVRCGLVGDTPTADMSEFTAIRFLKIGRQLIAHKSWYQLQYREDS